MQIIIEEYFFLTRLLIFCDGSKHKKLRGLAVVQVGIIIKNMF